MPSSIPMRSQWLLAFVLSSASAFGQADPLEENWRWSRFATESGVPSDRVLIVVEDSEGSPWIMTDSGLAWYDGFQWRAAEFVGAAPTESCTWLQPDLSGGVLLVAGKRLYQGDRAGLHARFIEEEGEPVPVTSALPLDSKTLLIRTVEGTFFRSAAGILERLPSSPGTNKLESLLPRRTRGGTIWAATTLGTFAWRDGAWVSFSKATLLELEENEGGEMLAVDDQPVTSRLWTTSGQGALVEVPVEKTGFVRAMALDEKGDTIVVFESGRVRIRRKGRWSWLPAAHAPLRNARFLRFARNGDLWVGTDFGITLHRGSSTRWTRWMPESTTPGMQVNALLETPEGDMWIGTREVRRSDGSSQPIRAVPRCVITGLILDTHGTLWVSSGASDGFPGAYRYDGETWSHFGGPEGLPAPRVHRIAIDRHGRLWFLGIAERYGGTEPGALAYDQGRFARWGVEEGLPSGRVYALAEGRDGELWFGTARGLSRWTEGVWTHWSHEQGLHSELVFTLAVDADGRPWFGHRAGGGGLGHIDEHDHPAYLTAADGLVHSDVNELRFDREGALWITTRNGVSRYVDGHFSSFRPSNGLLHPNVWPMVIRPSDVLFGTTGGGVYRLEMAETDHPVPVLTVQPPRIEGQSAHFRWSAAAYWGAPRSSRDAIPTERRAVVAVEHPTGGRGHAARSR